MQLPEGFNSSALRLSGGQQQRVAIARLFIKDPAVILLDEPTASLDAIATEQIKASIDAIKKGRTVIIISHNLGQIIDADQLYVLEEGRVVQSGKRTCIHSNPPSMFWLAAQGQWSGQSCGTSENNNTPSM